MGPQQPPVGGRAGRTPLLISQGVGSLPQEQLSAVHQELQAIRHQQQVISGAINKIRREHEQLYGQAAAFQTLHDRHESSINAILTFLATVYNRSLEGERGQNFTNMFAGAIPHENRGQGNIVDIADFGGQDPTEQQSPFRRQPLLLKAAPISDNGSQDGRASTSSPAASVSSPQPQPQSKNLAERTQHYRDQTRPLAQTRPSRMTENPQILSGTPQEDLGRIPEADIMAMINNANANNNSTRGGSMDFPAALSHFENSNGNSPLTQGERADVLKLIANGTNTAQSGSSNALTSPSPPQMPSLQQWAKSQEDLDLLAKLQAEQNSKVQNLTNILQPLSPSGSIPGLTDNPYYGEHSGEHGDAGLDLDQIFNSGDYFTDHGSGNNAGGVNSFDLNDSNNNGNDGGIEFNFDDLVAGPNGFNEDITGDGIGRILETVNSSEATSPANTADDVMQDEGASPSKRRRRN